MIFLILRLYYMNLKLTRMATFIKAKLKNTNEQTNDKNLEWLQIKYHRLTFQSKKLVRH